MKRLEGKTAVITGSGRRKGLGYYVNWDRGFDAEGAHVWGPADGGYIFEKKEMGQ